MLLVQNPINGIPLLRSILHDFIEVHRLDGVHDVEEVLPVWSFIIGVLVLEVAYEFLIIVDFGVTENRRFRLLGLLKIDDFKLWG